MGDFATTIDVRYSCNSCQLRDVTVSVPVRAEEENVIQWMDGAVLPGLGKDHFRRSPLCRTETLADVKIPFAEGTKRLGDLPVQ